MYKTSADKVEKSGIALNIIGGILLSCILLLGMITTGCHSAQEGNQRRIKMDSYAVDQVDILSADLVPFFGEPNANMLLAKIIGLKLGKQVENGLEVEIGPARLDVIDVLNSPTLKKGDTIAVPVKRIADPEIRDRNGINQWNNLDLTTGEMLLLSGRVLSAPDILMGQAAIHVDSAGDSKVDAARQCYAIERLKDDPDKKRSLLLEALIQPEDLLRYYALDVLGRRSVLGRAEGAELISEAIASVNIEPQNRVELGYYLTRQYFFDNELKADPANVTVVEALAWGLVSEKDADLRMEWLNYLGSCVLGEFSARKETDQSLRYALIRAMKTPPADQVTDTLAKMERSTQAEEHERVKELMQVWHSSGATQ